VCMYCICIYIYKLTQATTSLLPVPLNNSLGQQQRCAGQISTSASVAISVATKTLTPLNAARASPLWDQKTTASAPDSAALAKHWPTLLSQRPLRLEGWASYSRRVDKPVDSSREGSAILAAILSYQPKPRIKIKINSSSLFGNAVLVKVVLRAAITGAGTGFFGSRPLATWEKLVIM